MTEDKAPPIPLPPEAEPPYPPHGAAAHPQRDEALNHMLEGPGIGALGVTLIGGAVAATVGLLFAIPLLRRKAKPAPAPTSVPPKTKAAPRARRPRRKPAA
jgi:hypothetical protein